MLHLQLYQASNGDDPILMRFMLFDQTTIARYHARAKKHCPFRHLPCAGPTPRRNQHETKLHYLIHWEESLHRTSYNPLVLRAFAGRHLPASAAAVARGRGNAWTPSPMLGSAAPRPGSRCPGSGPAWPLPVRPSTWKTSGSSTRSGSLPPGSCRSGSVYCSSARSRFAEPCSSLSRELRLSGGKLDQAHAGRSPRSSGTWRACSARAASS